MQRTLLLSVRWYGGWDYHKERMAQLKSYFYYHPPTLSRRAEYVEEV